LRSSNKTFVPASEPRISIYAWRGAELALSTGAAATFHRHCISNPEAAVRQCLRLFALIARASNLALCPRLLRFNPIDMPKPDIPIVSDRRCRARGQRPSEVAFQELVGCATAVNAIRTGRG
jgi:hypothetical protein